MSHFKRIYQKNISSDNIGRQIWGALVRWRTKPFLGFVFLLTPLSVGISYIFSPGAVTPCLLLLALNLIVWLIVKVCRLLTEIYSLKRNENGITSCQIIILAAFGLWIVGFAIIFDLKNNARIAAAIGVVGGVLGWIFQDKVKGVAAFINLRRHRLLNIGDWIKVPKMGVDGTVEKVTLTTVTLYNWDTTTSTIPLSALLTDHFMNFQNMSEGKTYGRKMTRTFLLDTGCFHAVSGEELSQYRSEKFSPFIPEEEVVDGVLNARLFRLYIYHWLMRHPQVSQQPTLLVRWMDHQESGMQLQIYAFIIDSRLVPFEWHQSQIVEHIIESMGWFGLKLYQAPTAYDVGNRNIHRIVGKSARRRKEGV